MSKGLGDRVEEVFEKTGVKTVVEKVTDVLGIEDCGCAKRKELLNSLGGKPEVVEISEDGFLSVTGDPDTDKHLPVNRRARNAAKKKQAAP